MQYKGFTEKQLQWAQSHDWFVWGNARTIATREYIITKKGTRAVFEVFHNFKDLLKWAGY